ncbi:MAG: hypothetical protein AAB250_00375 [Bdellovibrionota bacterium]
MRRFFAIVIFLISTPVIAQDLTILDLDWDEIEPPSSIGFNVAADSLKGRSSSLDLAIALPNAWSIFASVGQSTYESADRAGSQQRSLTQGAFGFSTDPLADFIGSFSVDQQKSADDFSDGGVETRVVYQPPNGLKSFAFGLGLGARNFSFKPDPVRGAPKAQYDIPSRSVSVGVDWFVTKRMDVHVEGTRYFYPDEVSTLREAYVPLFVPSETLNYAFGLPASTFSLAIGSYLPLGDWRKPRIGASISTSKSVVDDLTTLNTEVSLSLKILKSLEGRTALGASRAKDDTGTQPVRSAALSVAYIW